jgi:hypothetical protein
MSGDERGYSGWRNYETWCVNLWLANDHGMYLLLSGRAADVLADHDGSADAECAGAMADVVREFVEELRAVTLGGDSDEELASMFSDLLSAAMSEVDWREIAESWLGDAVEAAAESGE